MPEVDPTPETSVGVSDDLRVVAGNPTPEELAAVMAVVAGIAAELGSRPLRRAVKQSTAWAASQRPIREPILHGTTRWRGFSG
ncbi:MAG: acyl-CoA carboxylase subunit epsilon [Cryobacterium sp.]|nr:acyl-CoA carboxylase subunit epsilon [Cryobacterium sp.]